MLKALHPFLELLVVCAAPDGTSQVTESMSYRFSEGTRQGCKFSFGNSRTQSFPIEGVPQADKHTRLGSLPGCHMYALLAWRNPTGLYIPPRLLHGMLCRIISSVGPQADAHPVSGLFLYSRRGLPRFYGGISQDYTSLVGMCSAMVNSQTPPEGRAPLNTT